MIMISIVLYSSAVVKINLTTSQDEDRSIREKLEELLGEFGWYIQYVRTPKESSWSFSKVFGIDPDLQNTRYRDGITFAKFLDTLNSLELAIEGSVKNLAKTHVSHKNNEWKHVELAIREDDRFHAFWLVRSFLKKLVVNYYVPKSEKSKVASRIHQIFRSPVDVTLSRRDIDDEMTLICARLHFPYGYDYRILSHQKPVRLRNTLKSFVRKHYGYKYQDRGDIASAIIMAYEGKFRRAREIALTDYNNCPADLQKVKMDLVTNINALEKIISEERSMGETPLNEIEKDEALVKLRERMRTLGILYPPKNIHQLNVDISFPIKYLRASEKSIVEILEELDS